MKKKMIYIMNHYSSDSAKHFFHIINLLERIAEKDVEIVLIIEKAKDTPIFINSNIKVILQKENKPLRRAKELREILKSLYKKGYKKVFVRISSNAALIAINTAKRNNVEIFYWNSGDNITYDKKLPILKRIRWFLTTYMKLKYIRNNVDFFVTGPETMIEYYIDNLKINRDKMLLLYNDIDINRFSKINCTDKEILKKELHLPLDKKIVLFVHRLTPVKKFDLAIPFLVEHNDFTDSNAVLLVIGDGPDRPKIEAMIEKSHYKDNIIMRGRIPNNQVMDYYKVADVFINPSYSEGFPRVVIEAMASGLPVVVTDVGGTKDIIPEIQKEFLVDKDDRVKFRSKVLKILNDKTLKKKLAEANEKYVKKYSTDNVSKMYVEKIFYE